MPVIRISPQTWERLKRHATPLVHSANDVVEMALEALERQTNKRGRIVHAGNSGAPARKKANRLKARGKALPLKQFQDPLLETLFRQGGKAYSREIRETMEQTMAPVLCDADYELVSNGQPRWWNSTCSMRNQLIKNGILRADSERGVWELSKQGLRIMKPRRG
jgi:hypothetical protein